jgi:hypothetical protein
MEAGRRPLLFLSLLLAVSGCRHNQELLETELRTKEIQYRELLDEFDKAKHHNQALEREVADLRHGVPIPPEVAAQTFTVKRITLGRMTGGQNTDKVAGDDALQVVLEPRDGSDHVIKAPGTLQVWTLDIDSHGVKVPLNSWVVGPGELGRSWRSGFLGSSYTLTLPWKNWPHSENVRVVVRLVLGDGRIFEADRDVKVRLTPGAPRHTPDGPNLPEPHFPDADLHMPRPVPEKSQASPGSPVTAASTWLRSSLEDAVSLQQRVPMNT